MEPHQARDLINKKIFSAERLISAGVNTNIYTQWGVGHLAGNAARAATPAKESLDVAVAALRGVFNRETNIK